MKRDYRPKGRRTQEKRLRRAWWSFERVRESNVLSRWGFISIGSLHCLLGWSLSIGGSVSVRR